MMMLTLAICGVCIHTDLGLRGRLGKTTNIMGGHLPGLIRHRVMSVAAIWGS